MPTNANTFNSRVTSEALEAKFRQVFPAQGGAELVQDLFASGVIQPVVDFSSVAEGSVLPANLQTAWDFSTTSANRSSAGTTTLINNTGFWQVRWFVDYETRDSARPVAELSITDGLSTKRIIQAGGRVGTGSGQDLNFGLIVNVFVKTGESVVMTNTNATYMTASWRQIADVNGNLVNPLGFVFS